MSEPDHAGVEADTPIGKFRIRGTDTIVALGLVGIVAMAASLYYHMQDTERAAIAIADTNKEVARVLVETNKGMTSAIQEVVKAQRLSTCILATDQNKREKEYMKSDSFCNRVSQ